MRRSTVLFFVVCALGSAPAARAHDAHGRSNAPQEARRLKNPVPATDVTGAKPGYDALCASCHGEDGRSRTKAAAALPHRPTDLTDHLMDSMKDGEIYWVIANGIKDRMPAFGPKLTESARWRVVNYVRSLRARQSAREKAALGSYDWNLPPGFPYPNVPAANPMTIEKVELGRYLFYDRRLSLNQSQSCASCHRQDRAFADARGRGVGSTGERHPRGPMSLVNVAYAPVLTWANPNVRSLETQTLVPLFGDHPVELGMTGKEDLLLRRLQTDVRYPKLFAAAFPAAPQPFSVLNITRAIASFERTILSGDSPYDRYQRGDDAGAISESAKRGEALFFSERLECFHCHGGFNFTGTVDYLGKGFAEIEFHNTGLYNLSGKFSYPEPNLGLFEFTQQIEDVGKFKAPTLRNIALTAPYMHDGSVATLAEVIGHYRAGGRTVKTGPLAGIGFQNPNKSEFVKSFELSAAETADLLAFLRSLTDESLLNNPALADPWRPSFTKAAPAHHHVLHGEVLRVFPADGAVSVAHGPVPGFMDAMSSKNAMEFLVPDKIYLESLKPGMKISAGVRRQGSDYILEPLKRTKP